MKNIYETLLKSLLLVMMICVTMATSAVPSKPGLVRSLQLADGTTVIAHLVGDEFGHYWKDDSGKAYQMDEASGRFVTVDAEAIHQKAAVCRRQANAQRSGRLPARRKVGMLGSYTGQKKGLIILVNFKDVSFKAANNLALWKRIANEENFSEGNFVGSMYDYFYAQSEGQFELTFDVVGPVTVSQKRSYYGGNDSQGNDKHPATMVREACLLADSQVNYADYDWDDDGYVDQVYVVYAGKGEADGGAASTIWPHAWSLSSASYYRGDGDGEITLDDTTIDTYACGGELNGQTGDVDGIGTMCHEFSHCLGYPDFYDIDYSGGQGMGYWDLMSGGSYNGDGYRPAGYTGYERWVAGWKEPVVLSASKTVIGMKPLQEGGECYIIYNRGNRNEYYMLENRQRVGWDLGLPGKGLLIIHVDYDDWEWYNNTPNDDPGHQRMTWIPADNEYQYTTSQGTKYYTEEGMENDPFPYESVKSFGPNTTPAATLYNANTDGSRTLDASIENIIKEVADRTISFNFYRTSIVVAPTLSPVPGQYEEPKLIRMSCETEGATIYYTTDGTSPTTHSTPYTHPFYISESTNIKAIAVVDDEESEETSVFYDIGIGGTFKLVRDINDLKSGRSYIITAGEYNTAAGPLVDNRYLRSVDVTVEDDSITLEDGSDVLEFTLEGSGNLWAVKNETYGYLYSKGEKKLRFLSYKPVYNWTFGSRDGAITIRKIVDNYFMHYSIKNSRFTTYLFDFHDTNRADAYIYMKEYKAVKQRLVGDANGDGEVNISDVTITVQHLLNDLTEGFVFYNADVNEDGEIYVSDVTGIVDIILGLPY